MAADLNVVALTGGLTKDVELKHIPSGTAVAELRLAFTNRSKRNGEWQDVSNYIDVTVWGGLADNCAQYLAKGSKIAVSGRLEFQEWEDKSGGGKRSKIVLVADSVRFLSRANDGGEQGAFVPAEQSGDFGTPTGGAPDDDIPF